MCGSCMVFWCGYMNRIGKINQIGLCLADCELRVFWRKHLRSIFSVKTDISKRHFVIEPLYQSNQKLWSTQVIIV